MTEITPKPSPKLSIERAALDPDAQYAAATARDGVLLKFTKEGEWVAAHDSPTVIPDSTELVALMPEFALAWTRWADGRPTDRHVTLVASGAVPMRRDQLGDNDQSQWETDDEGHLRDPWQASHELPLLDQMAGEKFVYATNSVGGKGALGKLAYAYSRGRVHHPDQNPVVALGSGGYQHRIKSRGYIHVPTLKIVRWVPEDPTMAPALPALPDVMNDKIPF